MSLLVGVQITSQVLFALPELGAKDRAILERAVDLYRGGTQEFSRARIRTLTGGVAPEITLGRSYLVISLTVKPEYLAATRTVLRSYVTQPSLMVDDLPDTKPATVSEPFLSGLKQFESPTVNVTRAKLEELAIRIFQPKRMISNVPELLVGWTPPTVPPGYFDLTAEKPIKTAPVRAGLMEWIGEEVVPVDPNFNAFLASVAMLGVGKGSTLFDTAREKLRLSYRQEALLELGDKGFRPRVTLAVREPGEEWLDGKKFRQTLLEQIEAWSEDDLARGKGVWKAMFQPDFPFTPFVSDRYLFPSDAPDLALIQVVMHHWVRKPTPLVGDLNTVSLADAKAAAKQWVTNTRFQFVPVSN